MFSRVAIFFLAVIIMIGAGCANFHTRYFARAEQSEVRLDRFRLSPRLFAFQEKKGLLEELKDHPFVVSIRLEDTQAPKSDVEWKDGQTVIDSLADVFLQTVRNVFVVDSLVFHQTPDNNDRIHLLPDRENFSPRRENFLTLKFDKVKIPLETTRIRAVLHVSRQASASLGTGSDSAVWLMDRVDTLDRGMNMFRDQVRGYE